MSSTNAIFSKEYYFQPLFLSNWHLEKLPDGGLRYSTPPFYEFWNDRNVQANVDEYGKVNFATYSFFDRLKYAFSLSPDQNLIAAHRRLKALETQVQNSLSPDLQRLKNEIHYAGLLGAIQFKGNLHALNKVFEEASGNSLAKAIVKIANFINAFLHWKLIEVYNFTPINIELFKERAITPALELTPQERLSCSDFPILLNQSSFPSPQLTRENLQKLKLGLITEIPFILDQKEFCLWFDNSGKEFVLNYLCDQRSPPPGASQMGSFTWSAPILNVSEKKVDGSTATHSLQRIIQCSHQKTWTGDRWSYAINGGALHMKMNSEYTIPLSRGNFSIKLFRSRTSLA